MALPPQPGSARGSPDSSAAIPTTFLLTAPNFPPLPRACAVATPGRFLSPAPGTESLISLRSGSLRAAVLPFLISAFLIAVRLSLSSYFIIFSCYYLHSSIQDRPQQHRHRPPFPRERIAGYQRDHAHR